MAKPRSSSKKTGTRTRSNAASAARRKATKVSAETNQFGPVPLAAQDEAAAAQEEPSAADAAVELHDVDVRKFGDTERIDLTTAEDQGEILQEVVMNPTHPGGDRLQDPLHFENARRDEAVAQGVEKTTQERLWELARQEEAEGQGLDSIGDTTQKRLFRESRAEEVWAEKLEETPEYGEGGAPAEPVTIGTEGRTDIGADVPKSPETVEESESTKAQRAEAQRLEQAETVRA